MWKMEAEVWIETLGPQAQASNNQNESTHSGQQIQARTRKTQQLHKSFLHLHTRSLTLEEVSNESQKISSEFYAPTPKPKSSFISQLQFIFVCAESRRMESIIEARKLTESVFRRGSYSYWVLLLFPSDFTLNNMCRWKYIVCALLWKIQVNYIALLKNDTGGFCLRSVMLLEKLIVLWPAFWNVLCTWCFELLGNRVGIVVGLIELFMECGIGLC